jgi:tetratricopeptide (TPR) repeat protein
MLGQLFIDQHRVAEARQQFTDVVRLHPHAVTGPIMLGLLAFSEGDYATAAKWWERALEISPRSAAAANNLAWLYSEHDGNLDVALQLAQTARSAFPDQSDIADTLGWVYYKKKSTTQAIAVLQPIAEKDTKNAAYSYHLGMAYAQAGDDAKARRALEQALRVSKDFDGAATARKTLESLVY